MRLSLLSGFSRAAHKIIQNSFEKSVFIGKYAPIDLQKMTLQRLIFHPIYYPKKATQFQLDSRISTIERLHRATAIIPTLEYSVNDLHCENIWPQSILGIQKVENNFCKFFWMRFSIAVNSTLSPMRAASSTCTITKCIESTTHRQSLCRCGCLPVTSCLSAVVYCKFVYMFCFILSPVIRSFWREHDSVCMCRLVWFWCDVWHVLWLCVELKTQWVGPTHRCNKLAGSHRDYTRIEIDYIHSHGIEIIWLFLLIICHPIALKTKRKYVIFCMSEVIYRFCKQFNRQFQWIRFVAKTRNFNLCLGRSRVLSTNVSLLFSAYATIWPLSIRETGQ